MLLEKVFEPFIKQRPICVMARSVLERLLNPERLDALFKRVAQRQYTQELLFSQLAGLVSEVTLSLQPSVHAAYQAKEEEIAVSTTALYNKLDRVENGVSAELVRDSYREAEPVVDALKSPHPDLLPGYRVKFLDGNHLSATEHRIQELRSTWAAALPGKALVVLDQRHMLIENVFLAESGHAQERSLINEVLPTVKAGDLWIADRNFCTLSFFFGIMRRRGFFLIRQHEQLKGRLVGKRKCIGKTDRGTIYEQKLILTDPETGEGKVVRRITIKLKRKTRDGDSVIHLLSNIPEEDANGIVLSELYRLRWTIETAFFEITTTLTCEVNTLGYPKAALFAFCLALLAYNAVSVIKAALRSEHGEEKINREVSAYYLALEIQQTYDGMMVAIPAEHWLIFRKLPVTKFAKLLRSIAAEVKLSKYKKHPRGPKKKPPPKTPYQNGSHVATAKILAQRNTC
jgi:hypothetical protein